MGAVDRLLTNLATVRENLKEEEAKSLPNFDGVDIVFNHEGELYRAWVFDTTDLLDLAVLYLKTSGYVGPSDANYVSGRHVITDPLIDGYAVPGVFRVSGVRRVAFQGKYYAVQSLRRGYARAIDWSEAYLAEGHSQIGPFETRLVEFKAFDPECTEQARAALTGQTYTDPIVQRQTLTGAWRTMDVIVKPSQDGTYVIGLMLQSVTAATYQYKSLSTAMRSGNTIVYENWPHQIYAPGVTGSGIYRAQNTVNERRLYDAVLTYEAGTSQGVVPFRSMSTLFRQGNTILYRDWPSKIEAPVASGSGMYRAQNELTDDGLYNSILVYENGTGTGRIDFTSLSTLFRSGSTILYKSWPTKISAPPASGSGLYRVQQSINDDGTYDGALVYECGTATGQVQFKSLSTMFREGNTILYRSWPTYITAPTATGSGIYRVQQQLTDDGSYDGALVYECGTMAGAAQFRSMSTMMREGNTILYRSWPSMIQAPLAGAGGIYRLQQQMTEDALYDASLVYECGTETGIVKFRSLSTMMREGNTILYKSWPTYITSPVATGSGIYRVQQQLDDDGSYDGVLTYECGTATGVVPYRSLATVFRSGNTILYKSWPTYLTAPPSDRAGIYRVQQQLADDGMYDAVLTYECSDQQAMVEFRSVSTMTRQGNTILYKSWPERITAPPCDAGGIYRVQQQLGDDGMYDGQLVYDSAAGNGVVQFRSLSTMLREGNTIVYKSWPTYINSPEAGAGGVYRVQQQMSDDGLYDAAIVYECGTGSGVVKFRSLSTMAREGNTINYRSWPTYITSPTSGAGGIYRLSQQLGDDGMYDASLVYECSTLSGAAQFMSLQTMFRSGNTILYKGWPNPIDTPPCDAGGVYRAQNGMSDDGSYDATLIYDTGTPVALEVVSLRSAMSLVKDILYKNQPSAMEAPEYAAGVVGSASVSINDDGTYDGVVKVAESQPHAIYKAWRSFSGIHCMYIYRNWSSAVDISDDYFNVACNSTINDDFTYDTVVSISPAVAGGSSADWSDDGSHVLKLDNLKGYKGVGNYIVYIYQRRSFGKAKADIEDTKDEETDADPAKVYVRVPNYGGYNTGVWSHGRNSYQVVIVLYKA